MLVELIIIIIIKTLRNRLIIIVRQAGQTMISLKVNLLEVLPGKSGPCFIKQMLIITCSILLLLASPQGGNAFQAYPLISTSMQV